MLIIIAIKGTTATIIIIIIQLIIAILILGWLLNQISIQDIIISLNKMSVEIILLTFSLYCVTYFLRGLRLKFLLIKK